MKQNLFRSILAGMIIGFLLGSFYYVIPLRCLLTGPIKITTFIPHDLYIAILKQSFQIGGGIGVIIGLISGFTTPITMPRGHMSQSISVKSFFICTAVAFFLNASHILETSFKGNAVTIIFVVVVFFLTLYIGRAVSLIEKIRE